MTSRKLNMVVVSMVLLLAAAVIAHGRPGDIDPGFGDHGRVHTPYPPLVDRDGKLSLVDTNGKTVTVIDSNGRPVPAPGSTFPDPMECVPSTTGYITPKAAI